MLQRATRIRAFAALITLAASAAAGPVHAACTGPAGNEADKIYNQDQHIYQFCNGTSWVAFGTGGCLAPQTGAYQPTVPSGSGYFVMSGTQWNGSLGGRNGADALCYTELTSTNTSWKGYATALANGYLTATNIHAFLCDLGATCGNLMPLATYNFAVANNSAAGGATFTTDSNGNGPNDSANWSGASYFASAYTYWSNMGSSTVTLWSGSFSSGSANGTCSSWTTASSGTTGNDGLSSATNASRWLGGGLACNNTLNLICFVNP